MKRGFVAIHISLLTVYRNLDGSHAIQLCSVILVRGKTKYFDKVIKKHSENDSNMMYIDRNKVMVYSLRE